MARVLNKTNVNINLYSKAGDSCMIYPGENKIEDRFCTNLPPTVTRLDKPVEVASVVDKSLKENKKQESPVFEEDKEEKTDKVDNKKKTKN